MFKNDRTNFSKDTTTEEAKIILKEFETSLDKDHSNSVKLYQKICKKWGKESVKIILSLLNNLVTL